MLEAVEYLIEDNDRWISPEIEARMGSTQTVRYGDSGTAY